ncbi:MAG: RNA-protein complex protein Nop10 [Methanomicrobiales archaeon]|nr:RNA-protein complex protein Nop10 [Methanomicrobiales archaeon]
MSGHLRRCPQDGNYTLCQHCPVCGAATASPHPARYAPQDPWGKYRRMMRIWMT